MYPLFLEFIGTQELLLIMIVALVIFGPRKLPELGRSLGKSLGEFKKASEDFKKTWEMEVDVEKAELEASRAHLMTATSVDNDSALPIPTTEIKVTHKASDAAWSESDNTNNTAIKDGAVSDNAREVHTSTAVTATETLPHAAAETDALSKTNVSENQSAAASSSSSTTIATAAATPSTLTVPREPRRF